jgi:large subunit ribosomal protein L4e
MAAARPLVTVQLSDKKTQVPMPAVLLAPIRPDLVATSHRNMNKNKRQPYAVSKEAGHQTSAESWGTGRAVARIPRVGGGGTHRSGQGAFGNMCRGGRMFAPTKVWRKWNSKTNLTQRRHAVASALAASAVASLVSARGHRIENVAEVPLVLANTAFDKIEKTSAAAKLLAEVKATADIERVKASRKLRCGKGKARGRRHVQRRGPLVVYDAPGKIARSFRNIPGVELACVSRLNLLQLAPGGHVGRFIIWTQAAFEKLDNIFGTYRRASGQKSGYRLPRAAVTNSDLSRLINSDEIQSIIRPKQAKSRTGDRKKNPLVNLGALIKLNPYAKTQRRRVLIAQAASKAGKAKQLDEKRKKAAKKQHAAIKAGRKDFYTSLLK